MAARCSAGDRCVYDTEFEHGVEAPQELWDQYDSYGIYAGKWHEDCWGAFGYGNFRFDSSYAGETLEPEDY